MKPPLILLSRDPESVTMLLGTMAAAAAIGLSPYSALAAAGLAGYFGFADLPVTLSGLSAPSVWGTLLALTLLDGLLSHFRVPDLVWNAFHTIVRPLAALLYASAATAGASGSATWAIAGLALLIALLVHTTVLAVRTAAWTAGPVSSYGGFTLLRLCAAAAIAVLALSVPPFAAAITAVLVLAPLPSLPRVWGAASLTLGSLLTVLSRPDRLHNWHPAEAALSRAGRRAVETALGGPVGSARSATVSLARLGSHWLYRRGYLVVAAGRPAVFLYRRRFRPVALRLDFSEGRADGGLLVETLEIAGSRPYALCVGAESPPGPAILAELAGAKVVGGSRELGGGAGV